MSLTSCLRKAGDALNRNDRAEVLRRSRQYRTEGMQPDAAALKAIDEVLAGIDEKIKAATQERKGTPVQTLALPYPNRPTGVPLAEIKVHQFADGTYAAGRSFQLERGGEAAAALHYEHFATPEEAIADAVDYLRTRVQSAMSGKGAWADLDASDVKRAQNILSWLDKQVPPAGAAPATPAAAPAPKKRGPRATPSAETLRAEADLNAALADLGDLLGKGTRLNMVQEPNDAKLLPVLTRVLDAAFRLGYHSFMDSAKFALDTIREKVSPEAADALTLDHLQGAYIAMAGGKEGVDSKRAVIDVESKDAIEQHNLDEEQGDVSGGTPDLERDRSEPAGQPDAGAGVPGNVAGPAAAGAGSGARAGGRGQRAGKGATRTPDGGPVAGGERVNLRVDGGKRPGGPAPGDPGADFNQRGDGPGNAGVQPAPGGEAQADSSPEQVRSERERRQAQQAVDDRVRRGELKVTLADRASIDETLPYLLPAQRDDVHKAELRHAKADGYGMLFTNGTGTGKTFTGLGVAKRRQLLGQVDQLITVPDNKIAADWIESAKALNLPITQLADTKTAGEGIVITTYANQGENDELAKRSWQHVMADEAHSLMQSADGDMTGYLENLRAITYHPQGQHAAWMMRHREQHNELASVAASIDENNRTINSPDTTDKAAAALREENKALAARSSAISRDLGQKRDAIRKEWEQHQLQARTRTTFLSATPFAYHTSLEWGQGYLFDYKEGYPYELDGSRPYNQPDPRQYFFQTHLGYRMRYNKLTKPDTSKVDIGMLERQLNSWMKKQGSLSGRMLEVEPDYDRRFVLIDSGIGNRIDEAIEHLRTQSNEQYQRNRDKKADEPQEYGWNALQKTIDAQFDYLSRRYLLEAIKARESVPIVQEHLKMGRRVVVFHDYKKGSGNNPFDVPEAELPDRSKFDRLDDPQGEYEKAQAKVNGFNAARAQFRKTFPELFTELVQLKPPIDAYREAFKEGSQLLVINGDEKPKALLARYAQFQNDDGGPLVALVQSDKNKGWSGHDTTGKFQRVLLNLGLPTAPTKLIQLEGRIYRTGVVTDAIMRSLNTGTNWERWAFANTIATRASTAENLSMGELSRALRDSIIASFENADQFPPGHDGEGKGGKRMDRAANNVLTDFERAKTFYWATGKKTSRNKSEEGKDYYATPEPLGMKMVEWADARGGEDVLEPSAGHGAIARWFPDLANRTAIEPAPALMSKLAMAMNPAKDRLIDGTFEDHDIVNKYDAIVMNPPFGVGGKQALEHVAKAARHLRDGGRIVALIPSGPASDKRLEQFLHGKEERPVRPIGALRNSATGREDDVYKGDRFESRASWAPAGVIVSMDPKENVLMVRPDGAAAGMTTRITAQAITKIFQNGKRTEEFSPSEGLQLVADIKLPSVTFERAGTGVWSHIIVLEKTKEDIGTTKQVDLTGLENINELFDRIEKLGLRARAKPIEEAEAEKPAKAEPAVAQVARGAEPLIEHTTAKGKVIRGIVRKGITRAEAQKIDAYTFPKNGGFFIREKYLKNDSAQEPTPEYGDEYDVDLFGNAVPRPKPAAPKAPPRQRTVIRQQALDLEGSQPELQAEKAPRPEPSYYVDTTLYQQHQRELGTGVVNSPAEAATATSHLARGAGERIDVLVTDKAGKVLGVVGNFKGDRAEAPFHLFPVMAEVLQIKGAHSVWLSHNHPSGNPKLSPADINLAKSFDRALEHTGIGMRGILAVTHRGQFTYWDGEDEEGNGETPLDIPPASNPSTVPVFERELRDERLTTTPLPGVSEAAEVGKAFYLKTGAPGVMVLDASMALAAWVPIDEDMQGTMGAGNARRLYEGLTRSNAVRAIIIHGGELDRTVDTPSGVKTTPLKNVLSAMRRVRVPALDAVNVKTMYSVASNAGNLEGGGELFAIQSEGGIWRSELEEAVSKATMKQAPASGWLSFLDGLSKRGVKPAEIEWSGVREWLQMLEAGAKTAAKIEKAEGPDSPFTQLWNSANPGRISKEEVLLFLGTNGVKVSEVLKGKSVDDQVREFDDLIVKMDAAGFAFDRRAFDDGDGDYNGRPVLFMRRSDGSHWEAVTNGLLQVSDRDPEELPEEDRRAYDPSTEQHALAKRMREIADNEVDDGHGADDTKFESWTEPGGENYRELLLTMPAPDFNPRDVKYVPLTELPPEYENNFDSSQPEGKQWAVIHVSQLHGRPYGGIRAATPEAARAEALDLLNSERDNDARDAARDKARANIYTRSHWDEENVLAHIRTKDRYIAQPGVDLADIGERIRAAVGAKSVDTLGNGAPAAAVNKGAVTADEAAWFSDSRGFRNVDARPVPKQKVLFVEEIQSDWAQQGRDNGFRDDEPPQERLVAPNEREDLLDRMRAAALKKLEGHDISAESRRNLVEHSGHGTLAVMSGMEKEYEDLLRRERAYREQEEKRGKRVPRAPFVGQTDAWVGLALKRVIHFAATNGYDKVAFVNGRQTADRYSMRKHVQAILYEKNDDGTYKLGVRARGGSANSAFSEEVGGTDLRSLKPSELDGIIGAELADKIRAGEGRNPWGKLDEGNGSRLLEGLDLEVGGEGHLAFYDKIVPAALKRLLPKFGGTGLVDVPLQLGGRNRGGVSGIDAMDRAGIPPEEQRSYWENLSQTERDALIEKARDNPVVPTQRGFDVTPAMREAALQGMPLFNRPRMTTEEVRAQLAAARGMSIEKTQAAVQSITNGWKGGITIKVVATPQDLPTSNPHPATKGLYLNGVGYVVASKHKTVQELGRTIAHEVLAHHGLRNSLGEDGWRRLMGQIQAAANAGNPEIAAAREYVRQAYRHPDGSYMLKEGGTIEADEVAARLIESSVDAQGNMKPKLQFLKWVWAKIASFLRSVGVKVPLTVAELHGVYADALADIRAGKGVLTGELATADGLEARGTRTIQVGGKERPIENADGNTIATEFKHQQNFWKWFGDSKAVDAQGRPLVLYHGTRTADRLAGEQGFDRYGAHFGTSVQANMRARGDGNTALIPVYVSVKNPKRMIDKSEWSATTYERAKKEGHDGIVYLNRYEVDGREVGDGKGDLTDEEFKKLHPEAEDSYIVFHPEQVKSVFNRGAFNPKDGDILYAIDIAGGGARPGGYTPEQMTAMRNVGFAREMPPLKDRLRAMWKDAGKKLAQGIVDQFAPIKDISKEAYGLLRLSKGASGAFEVLLHGGQLKLNAGVYDFDEKKRGGAIERLLIPLQGEHHDFLRWIAANRAEQLTKEDREHLFTADDIRALKTLSDGQLAGDFTLQHGPKAGKTTRSRAEAWADSLATFNEFNKNTLDMAQESGLIDPEGRKLWEREFYVPFYRVEDEGGVRGMNIKSGVVRQQAFKHLKGGTQQLNNDLLENTLMNWAHLIDAAAKNRAAKATLEAMQNMGSAIEAPENDVRQMGKSMGKRHNVVWFMDAGRQRHFLVDDPYLLAAVSALEFSGFNSPVMKALGATKRALTMGVTASPFFKVRNLIRDTVQAIGSAPLSANPLANVREGLAVVGKGTLGGHNTDEWYRLLAGGGTIHFGTMMEGSEAKRVQALIESGVDKATILDSSDKVMGFYRHTVEPLITAYNELGNRGEAINRAALYQQLRKQGVSHAEASLQARDLMDFSMQGSFTTVRFLTQVVPFMNARLQGLYKLGRAAAEDPARFAAVLTATSVLSIGLLAAYSDDDDWKKREDWDRNNYWWFKAGGTAYRIPKPFEIGAMATLAERTWELAFEREMTNQRFRQQVIALLGDNLSMNPIPQLVKPIIDVYANTDSFTNRPIEAMGMEKLQPQYRFREDTSMLARGASTVLSAGARTVGAEGLSPLQLEHLMRGYFGWLGTLTMSAGDVLARPATDQPAQPTPDYWKVLTGSMVAGMADAPSRYVTDVYQQSKQLEQIYGTWSHLVREGKMQEAQAFRGEYAQELVRYRQVEGVKRAMTQINQLKKQVEEGAATADEKRARLRELNDRADLIARRLAPV